MTNTACDSAVRAWLVVHRSMKTLLAVSRTYVIFKNSKLLTEQTLTHSAPPLEGIRVVDLSTVLSGPLAASMLADQGAEVIKVESLEGDTCRLIGPAKGDLSAMYIATNRGKKSLAMDLKAPQAKAILAKLLVKADVVINNFRPGVMARLGLDDEALVAINPRLIRLSITGFGTQGDARDDKAYDAVIQAVTGVAATQRNPINGQPTVLATAVCDKLTALTASQAIVSALFARERDGKGRRIDLSMLDASLAFQWPDAMYNHVFMEEPPATFPEFGINQKPYKTLDGFVASMCPQNSEFRGQCKALGREDIADDPRFATLPLRTRHGKELRELIEPLMATFTTQQLIESFRQQTTPIGRINERQDVLTDAQVVQSGSLVEFEHGKLGKVRLPQHPAFFDGKRLAPSRLAAHLGEHGWEVMHSLGYTDAEIQNLTAAKVLKVPPAV